MNVVGICEQWENCEDDEEGRRPHMQSCGGHIDQVFT